MTFPIKLLIFGIASAGIIWISRASLRDFRAHGFYRFFAWETILLLFLINVEHWFHTPFSPHQLLSWLLLIISLFLIIHGVRLFRQVGKLDSARADPSLIGIEKTTQLVTTGAYRYIRHPFYSSLLFLVWGIFFKQLSWFGVCLAVVTTMLLVVTAKIEESENKRYFGETYQSYMARTKMFIPFLF